MAQQLAYGYEGDRQYSAVYRHSGKVTFRGTAAAAVAGLVAAILLGAIYAYGDLYSPLAYLNILLCIGFGAGLGFVVAAVLRWGKVRNVPVALAIVGVTTLAAYYVCWVAWIFATLQRFGKFHGSPIHLLERPDLVWGLAKAINKVGTWSTSSASSSARENEHGVTLWLIWAGEAIAIFGGAFFVVKKMIGDLPFCERCDVWGEDLGEILRFGAGDNRAATDLVVAHDFAALPAIPTVHSDHFVSLTLHACRKCNVLNTVTATEIKITYDRHNKTKKAKKVLVNKMFITPDEVQFIRTLAAPPAAPVFGEQVPTTHVPAKLLPEWMQRDAGR